MWYNRHKKITDGCKTVLLRMKNLKRRNIEFHIDFEFMKIKNICLIFKNSILCSFLF